MVVVDPIVVTQIAQGTFSPAGTYYGSGLLVGYGNVSTDYDEKLYVFTDLNDIEDYYGSDSALYAAAYLFFLNGGSELWCVQHKSSAGAGDTQSGNATGKIRTFTIAGVVTQVLKGSLTITVDLAAQTEGIDYIVDYSQGIVHFKVPPADGVDNVVFAWEEATTTNIEDALEVAETELIEMVSLAYLFGNTYLTQLKTHLTTVYSAGLPRIGFIAGLYLDASATETLGSNADSKRISVWSNRSGYRGTDADPDSDWLDFVDPASIVMGISAARKPWLSLHARPVSNLNYYQQWTTTEIGDEDLGTGLLGSRVNIFFRNRYLGRHAVSIWKGFTSEQAKTLPFVHLQRTLDFATDRLKAGLILSTIFGELAINYTDMESLYNKAFNVLLEMHRLGAIANPYDLPYTHYLSAVDFPVFRALSKTPQQRTSQENSLIQTIQNTGKPTMRANIDHEGALLELPIELAIM